MPIICDHLAPDLRGPPSGWNVKKHYLGQRRTKVSSHKGDFMKIPIDSIKVGERRREELGDIEGLANSIKQNGLIQPIVVDADLNLVAGERRITACRQLGMEEIEVTQRGELTEQQLRALELEENLWRKDLTEYKKSKAMMDYVEVVKEQLEEEFLSESDENLEGRRVSPKSGPRGGRPKKAASQAKVAERTGLAQSSISEAKSHVEVVEAFPFMKDWPQDRVLYAKQCLNRLPKEKYPQIDRLVAQPNIPSREAVGIIQNLADMPLGDREEIYTLDSGEQGQRELARSKATGIHSPTRPL